MSLTTTSRPPRWAEVAAHVIPLLYLPMVAWAPLLGALTHSCRRRRLEAT